MFSSSHFQWVYSLTVRVPSWCWRLHTFWLVWGLVRCRHLLLCLHRVWLHCYDRWDGFTWTLIFNMGPLLSNLFSFLYQEKRWRILSGPFPWVSLPRSSSVFWHTLVCLQPSLWWCRTTCWTRTVRCQWPLNMWAGRGPLTQWPLALCVPCRPGETPLPPHSM